MFSLVNIVSWISEIFSRNNTWIDGDVNETTEATVTCSGLFELPLSSLSCH